MASNYTEHYGLCQWKETDQVLREEFNRDHVRIDTELEKRAQIYIGSYIGTNQYGAENANHLTFDFVPQMLIIAEKSATRASDYTIMLRGQSAYANFSSGGTLYGNCLWEEYSITWYSKNSASEQFNYSNTYYYLAIG